MTARFCSGNFLSCPGQRVGESAKRGVEHSFFVLPASSLSLFFPATWVPSGDISHPPTNCIALCVRERRCDWLHPGVGKVRAVFVGLLPAAPSDCSHRHKNRREEEEKKEDGN